MKKLLSLLIFSLTISCSTFRETHYFKDNLTPTPNYYKVEVRGSTLMSSSRYVSGYYDKGAVQTYFGEINQPSKGQFPMPVTKNCDSCKQKNGLKNKELVLLLSTNSDAIANSIGNLVKSKTVVNSLSLIANKDKLKEASAIQNDLSTTNTKIDLLIAKIDAYINIDTNNVNNVDQIKSPLLQYVKSELSSVSETSLPNTFKELQQFYLSNKNQD